MNSVEKSIQQSENVRPGSRKNSIANSNSRPQNGPDTANHISDQLRSTNESTLQSSTVTGSTPTHANGRATSGTPGRSSGRRPWRDQPNIGKYKLIRTLGRGNFAKVKLAEHVSTGRQVAVKVIDKTQLNRASLLKLFREVRIMKMLNHPNIVRLYEVIESERHVYLVMEYAPNGEVFDYLVTNGRMKEKEARAKFRQLVSAVEYCHCKKIVHRDLKAENLLLDKDFNIKLADFGFSNFYDGENKLDTFCGSPPYAAPELFQGQKYFGPEVDVWSLGVILYTLVSGSLPFDAQHLKELQSRVIRGKYRVPFYMSTDCELLLRKLLVLNPTKRKPLKTIMTDRWLNLGYEEDILEPYVEPPPDHNDPVRLAIMQKMGYQPDEVREALEKQSFNNVTAIYLLLADPATQMNLPPQSFIRSPKESKTDALASLHKSSVLEDAEHSARNSEVLTTESTPSRTSKTSNVDSTANGGSTKADAQANADRKSTNVSWLKQSSSAGPTSSRTGGPPTDNVSTGLPRIKLSDVTNNEAAVASGHLDTEPATMTTDAAWMRRNNTFTVKKTRPSGSDATPPDQSCHLSRAPQFSNIPDHLTSTTDTSVINTAAVSVTSATATDETGEGVVKTSDAPHPEASEGFHEPDDDTLRATDTAEPITITTKSTTPAIVYHRQNPFREWLRRTFSCHRPRTKNSGSPVRTAPPPDQAAVVRVDSNTRFTAVDMLNPEARHQFARNCPERATVAVASARHHGFPGKHGGVQPQAPLPERGNRDKADSISSASTMSRADTLNGSSVNTLNSESTRKCLNTPQTPKKMEEFVCPNEAVTSAGSGPSGPLEDNRNSPRLKLSTTTAATPTTLTRDPMTQWSMRLRVTGPTDKPRSDESQPATASPGQASSTVPSDTVAQASSAGPSSAVPSSDAPPTLTAAKPYTSTPTKSGQFFRRFTSRLSRSHTHGRADDTKRRDDTASPFDHPASSPTEAQSATSDRRTGSRLASEPVRTGSTGDLLTTNPVDPWTARQRERRPKSSTTASKNVTTTALTSTFLEPESQSSGTDARNGYHNESADDATLTARENEPFIPRQQESRSGRFSSVLTGSLGRRRLPGPDSNPSTNPVGVSTSNSQKPCKPRRLHLFYRLRIIGRDPNALLKETLRVLDQNGISYVHRNAFCLSCTNQPHSLRHSGLPETALAAAAAAASSSAAATSANATGVGGEEEDRLIGSEFQNATNLKWEIEVCRLVNPSRYGVKFKRISGDSDAFKQLEQTLTRQFTVPPA